MTRSNKIKKSLPLLLPALVMVALAASGYRKQVNNPWGSDLDVYLHAARMMIEGADMYLAPNRGDEYYPYPPLLAFALRPSARVPFEVAVLAWSVLNAALLAAAMERSLRACCHDAYSDTA